MADNRKVLSVKFVAEGIDTVKKQIEGLGTAGVAAANRLQAAFKNSSLGAALSVQLQKLKDSFNTVIAAGQRFGASWANVGQRLKAFQNSISGAVRRLLEMKAVLGLAAAGVTLLFKSFSGRAEQITQTANALGLTTDQYQRLTAAAKDASIEQTSLDQILAKFTIGVETAGDEADKAATKTDKLGKSLEKIVVKDINGKDKIVTIHRGIDKAAESMKKFEGVTKTGTDGLLQYAASLKAAGSDAEQLAKAGKDFGVKKALQAVIFFRNLEFQFDNTARAAAGLIDPLTDMELLIGNNLDTAFDNLGTNLLYIKDRLLAIFAPAVTKLVVFLTKQIQANEQAFKDWATYINDRAIVILEDFFTLLADPNAVVQTTWLKPLIDGVKEFWTAVKYVFTTLIPDAFTKLREYADLAAKKINEFFGTDLTGDSLLIAVALGYVSGAFGILIQAAWLLVAGAGAVATTIRLAAVAFDLLFVALRPVAILLGYLGAAIATFIGAPAWVGIAIVAALAVAGALIYAYWDDIKVYAEKTWNEIVRIVSDAGGAIADSFGQVGTEWSKIADGFKTNGLQGAFDEMSQQSSDFWTQFIADTKREVEGINEALKLIGVDLPASWEHIKNGAAGIWSDVKANAKAVWDGVASIISSAATGIGEAVSAVWTAASTAISSATSTVSDVASGILGSIQQALAAAGDVSGAIELAGKLVAPFTDAKGKIEETWTALGPILAAKGADIVAALASPLESVKSLPTAFSEAANAIPDLMSLLAANVDAGGQAVMGSILALRAQIEQALAGIGTNINLNGIVAAFSAAASAMITTWGRMTSTIQSQTAQMVSSVQSLISRLVSYLSALRSAIAAAKSEASSSSSSDGRAGRATGGYISGPGTGTSDSIPLWGSNGEFMVRAAAVKHWGLDMLYALNSMRMPRFAMGGLVGDLASSMTPRSFSKPLDGAGSRLSPYTLVFEGQQYPGFMGPAPDALQQIGKARVISRVASNGRAPKWRG